MSAVRPGSNRPPRLLLASLACLALAGCGRAPAGPSLRVPDPEHDFGHLLLGETREHRFVLENQGTATLEVSSVRSSCGCAVLGETSFSLAPGARKELPLRLHADQGPGALVKTVVIASNDPASPHTILHFRADIDPLYEVTPALVDFGVLVLGQTAARRVGVRLVGGGPLRLEEALDNPVVDAAVAPVAGEEGRHELTLTLKEDLGAGEKLLHVEFPTDHESGIPLRVPVRVQMVAPWSLHPPETVFFGPVAPGARAEVMVRVAEQLAALPTLVVELDAELERVLAARWSQEDARLVLEVQEDARSGVFLGSIRFRSERPAPFFRSLTVEGSVQP